MSNKRKVFKSGLAMLSAAVASAVAPLVQAAGVELKPGDLVFGTGSSNTAGAGHVYVFDPVAQSITQIGGDYFNGVGGLAIDAQFNLIVGTQASSTSAAGRLYKLNAETGSSSQLGTATFFNGIGGLALDAAGNIILGTQSNNTGGVGKLYTVNPTNGAATQLGTHQFLNGVGDLAINPLNGKVMVGELSTSTTGSGRLYTVDAPAGTTNQFGTSLFTNGIGALAYSPSGQLYAGGYNQNGLGTSSLYTVDGSGVRSVLGTANGFMNSISALQYVDNPISDDQLYLGTSMVSATGQARLYSVNPVTGVSSAITPLSGPGTFFNGITAMTLVPAQVEFTGGNNVVIDGTTTTQFMTGEPNWYSLTPTQTLGVSDLLSTMGTQNASVRTGSGQPNNEEGDLTLNVNLDFNGLATRGLTLRASDDVIINNSISDSSGTDDSLNLTLVANNARQTRNLPGLRTGLVDINASINLGGGNLVTSGKAFDNSAVGATIKTAGSVGMTHSGSVVIAQPFSIGGDVSIAAGTFHNTTDGTISGNEIGTPVDNTSIPVGNFTLNATGAVTIDGEIATQSFASHGTAFTNSVPLSSQTGDFTINHTGAVTLNANIDSAAKLTLAGSSLTNPGSDLSAVTDAKLTFTGPINLSRTLKAATITASGTDFTNTAALNAFGGGLTLNHTGAVAFNATADATGNILLGAGSFANSAAITSSGGSIKVNAATSATFNAAFSSASTFDITAHDFTSNGGGTVTTPGAATLAVTNAINIGGTMSVGPLTSSASTFDTTASIDAAGDVGITTSASVALNAPLTTTSNFSATGGTTFNSTPTSLTVAGAATLSESSNIDVNTVQTGSSFAVTSSGGAFTANGLTIGADLNINAAAGITFNASSTIGTNVTLASGGSNTTINAPLSFSGSLFDASAQNVTVTTSGSLSGGASTTLNVTAHTQIDGAVNVGPLVVNTDTFTSTATIDSTNSFTINPTGAVSIGNTVTTANGGDFLSYSGGTTFNSTAAFINASGRAWIVKSSTIEIGTLNAVQDIEITSTGDYITAGGLVSGTSIVLNTPSSVTLSGTNSAQALTSTGTNFTSPGIITTTAGNLILNHSGAVAIQNTVSVSGDFLAPNFGAGVNPSSFDNTSGPISVSGASTLAISGPVTIGADFTTGTFSSTGTTFNTSSGATLASSGSADIVHSENATIDGPLNTGVLTVNVPNITTTATIDASGNFVLTTNDATKFGNNVTTSSGDINSVTGNTLDSTGVTVQAANDMTLQRSSWITAGALHAGGNMSVTVDGAGGIDIANDSNVGGSLNVVNSVDGMFDTTGASINVGGAVSVSNDAGNAAAAGPITTSAVTAGTSMVLTGGGINANGLLTANAGNMDLTATTSDSAIMASAGITVNGGNLTTNGTVSGGQVLNTVGGSVNVTGDINADHTGDITTDAVTAGGLLRFTTSDSASITTRNLQTGSTLSLTGKNATINGTILAGGTTVITANAGPVTLNGNVAVTSGDFLSHGTSPTSFTSTSSAISVAGSTQILHNGDINANTIATGTSLTATTTGGSTFTSNNLTAGTTIDLTAPGGITLNGPVNAGSNTTLRATNTDALVDINAHVTLTSGNFSSTGVHFDNRDNGAITLPGNIRLDQSGQVTIASPISSTGNGSVLSFASSPTVSIDGTSVNVAAGTANFSGGSWTTVQNASKVHTNYGIVGSGQSNDGVGRVEMYGNDWTETGVTRWTVNQDLSIGGSASNNSGEGFVQVDEFAELIVGGRTKVWANDTLRVVNGVFRTKTLDLDVDSRGNTRGIFEFFSGEVNFTDSQTIGTTFPIAGVIGQGTGANMRLSIGNDRTVTVNNNSDFRSTMYVEGGTFTTGTLSMAGTKDKLKLVAGTFNLTNSDLVVGNTVGTLSNGTVSVPEGVEINVTNAAKKLKVNTGGLLQLTGGVVNAAGGTTNAGTISLQAVSAKLGGGTLTNSSTGRITGTGTVDEALVNSGEVRTSFTEALTFAAPGTYGAGRTGAVVNINSATGTIRMINGGTVEFDGGLINTGTITGDGTLLFGSLPVNYTGGSQNRQAKYNGIGYDNPQGLLNTLVGADRGKLLFSSGQPTNIFGDVENYGGGQIKASGGSVVTFYGNVRHNNPTNPGTNPTGAKNEAIVATGAGTKIVFLGDYWGSGYTVAENGGSIIYAGTVHAGNSPGFVFSTGTMDLLGEAIFELGGHTQASFGLDGANYYSYRQDIGDVNFGPTSGVNVVMAEGADLASNFAFAPGDRFNLWSFSSFAGNPLYVNLPTLPNPAWSWKEIWTPTSFSVEVSAIPEPTAISLGLVLAGSILCRRRSRK